MDFLRHTYFDILPDEMIIEILYKLQDMDNLINLLYSSGRIKRVYLNHKPKILRQIILNNYPNMNDIFDKEFSLEDLSNLQPSDISVMIEDIKSIMNNWTQFTLQRIPKNKMKTYNLVYQFIFSELYPDFYPLIEKYNFNNQLEYTDVVVNHYEGFTIWYPPYMFLMKSLLSNESGIERKLYFVDKNYILTFDDYGKIPEYGEFILINDSNFDPEIQDNEILVFIMKKLYMRDFNTYINFVNKLSKDKKDKILEDVRNRFLYDTRVTRLVYPILQETSDMLVDFASRI